MLSERDQTQKAKYYVIHLYNILKKVKLIGKNPNQWMEETGRMSPRGIDYDIIYFVIQ